MQSVIRSMTSVCICSLSSDVKTRGRTGHAWFSETVVPNAVGLMDASLGRLASGQEGQLHHKIVIILAILVQIFPDLEPTMLRC